MILGAVGMILGAVGMILGAVGMWESQAAFWPDFSKPLREATWLVAFRRGRQFHSLGFLVRHQRDGFLVEATDEMRTKGMIFRGECD